MRVSTLSKATIIVVAVLYFSCRVAAAECGFNRSSYSFNGTEREQASCLLRQVGTRGKVSAQPFDDDRLLSLVGESVDFSQSRFAAYVASLGVNQSDIGGPINSPLSTASNNDKAAPQARYFVIHDTSTPNYFEAAFPSDIDTADWKFNDLRRYRPPAHVFISRAGNSRTTVPFAVASRATKLESKKIGIKAKGLFLHVELVQPRRSAEGGSRGNDALHPQPPFTRRQLDRLAIVYLAASVRRGSYLVPAFHAVLDESLVGHDDPQGFPLDTWITLLTDHLDILKSATDDRRDYD